MYLCFMISAYMCRYNNMNALLLFIPAMFLFGDVSALVAPSATDIVFSAKFWILMTIAGLFGM